MLCFKEILVFRSFRLIHSSRIAEKRSSQLHRKPKLQPSAKYSGSDQYLTDKNRIKEKKYLLFMASLPNSEHVKTFFFLMKYPNCSVTTNYTKNISSHNTFRYTCTQISCNGILVKTNINYKN